MNRVIELKGLTPIRWNKPIGDPALSTLGLELQPAEKQMDTQKSANGPPHAFARKMGVSVRWLGIGAVLLVGLVLPLEAQPGPTRGARGALLGQKPIEAPNDSSPRDRATLLTEIERAVTRFTIEPTAANADAIAVLQAELDRLEGHNGFEYGTAIDTRHGVGWDRDGDRVVDFVDVDGDAVPDHSGVAEFPADSANDALATQAGDPDEWITVVAVYANGGWIVSVPDAAPRPSLATIGQAVVDSVTAYDRNVCDPAFKRLAEEGWAYDRFEEGIAPGIQRSSQDAVCVAGHFGRGVAQGVFAELEGLARLLVQPDKAAGEIYAALIDLPAAAGGAHDAFNDWKNELVFSLAHDPRRGVQMLGEVTGQTAIVVVGTKGVGSAMRVVSHAAKIRDSALVTRYRAMTPKGAAVLEATHTLTSKGYHNGVQPTFFNTSLWAKMKHSLNSKDSQFVSLTNKPKVAYGFALGPSRVGADGARVFRFQVRRGDLQKAWWNPLSSNLSLKVGGKPRRVYGIYEDLVPNKTKVYNIKDVTPKPLREYRLNKRNSRHNKG